MFEHNLTLAIRTVGFRNRKAYEGLKVMFVLGRDQRHRRIAQCAPFESNTYTLARLEYAIDVHSS